MKSFEVILVSTVIILGFTGCISLLDADCVEVKSEIQSNVLFVGFEESCTISKTGLYNVTTYSSIEKIEYDPGDTIIINGAAPQTVPTRQTLETMLADKCPVIIAESTGLLYDISEEIGMAVSADNIQVYGLYYNEEKDIQYTYFAAGFDNELDAIEEVRAGMDPAIFGEIENGVNGTKVCGYSFQCGDYGKISARNTYSLESEGFGKKYYLTKYQIQGIPNADKSKSKMGLGIKLDNEGAPQTLESYGPTTSSGADHVNITVSTSPTPISVSWGTDIPDVSVIDNSDFGQNIFEINYDINERSNSGKETLLVQPGLVASSEFEDGRYEITEMLTAEFCKKKLFGLYYGDYQTFTCFVIISLNI